MNLFFIPILLYFFTFSKSQLIDMKVCTDMNCNTGCVSWTATSGQCSPCQSAASGCSITNPSSIVTTSSITLYSDSKCTSSNIIQGTYQMPINLDQTCHILRTTDTNQQILSYRGTNLSASIGIIIGSIIVFIIMVFNSNIIFLELSFI